MPARSRVRLRKSPRASPDQRRLRNLRKRCTKRQDDRGCSDPRVGKPHGPGNRPTRHSTGQPPGRPAVKNNQNACRGGPRRAELFLTPFLRLTLFLRTHRSGSAAGLGVLCRSRQLGVNKFVMHRDGRDDRGRLPARREPHEPSGGRQADMNTFDIRSKRALAPKTTARPRCINTGVYFARRFTNSVRR